MTKKLFVFFLNLALFFFSTPVFTASLWAKNKTWNFNLSSDYTYNSADIEISSNQAQLKAATPPQDWYDASWNYRLPIVIDNSQNSSDLSDYQIEINLTSANFDFNKAQSNGQDFRFVDSDGSTLLSHLRTSYNSSDQTARFIVQIPTIPASSSKTIYLYYGNSTTFDLYEYFQLSVDSTAHSDYGLAYPVTYQFSIPDNSTNLKAYKRYAADQSWTQLTEKTADDFFNGIEAVRFDYSQNTAYVSVAFSSATDQIHLKITDSSGKIIGSSYQGIPDYYDNRSAAVTLSSDDWSGWGISSSFTNISDFCSQNGIWMTAGIYETNNFQPAAITTMQNELNDGYLEPGSHSRSHPPTPYNDYDSEIQGSKEDIISLFDFPPLNKKGSQDFLYVWIEPGGYSDDQVRLKLGQNKYLISRSIIADQDTYSTWDSANGLYNRAGVSIWADDKNLCSWADEFPGTNALNAKFDSVVAAGGIYHLAMHPYCITLSQLSDHLNYIKQKKNLWYAALGHLYVYHYIDDQNKVSVSQIHIEENQSQSASPAPSVTLGSSVRQHTYAVSNPSLQPLANTFLPYTSLSGFTETATKNSGQIKYQISSNAGNTWYWWNGSSWAQTSSGYSSANTAAEINEHLSSFPVGDGKFLFKAYFHSNGSQSVELNQISLDYSSSLTQLRLIDPPPQGYTNSLRPIFRWQVASTPVGGGLFKYSLEIDNGDSGDFSIDNIPTFHQTDYQTDKYIAAYQTSYISVYTRSSSLWSASQNDGALKPGKRHWKIIAADTAGNTYQESRILFVDNTAPVINLEKINQQPPFAFSGTITDLLSGDKSENKIASGPKQIDIQIQDFTTDRPLHSDSIQITQSYWQATQELITDNTQNQDNKYAPFSYTLPSNLSSGKYQITLIGQDQASNQSSPLSFNLNVSSNVISSQLSNKQNKLNYPSPKITPGQISPPSLSPSPSPSFSSPPKFFRPLISLSEKIISLLRQSLSFFSRIFD